MDFFGKFLAAIFESIVIDDSPSEEAVEDDEIEPTYVHHMSDDGEVQLTLSGNAHSPIE